MNDSILTPAVAEFQTEIPKKVPIGEFFVFFAGDVISGRYKTQIPQLRFGGMVRATSNCLAYRGGYIRQCEITQLRPRMHSESVNNVMPSERKHLAPAYEITENGKKITVGIDKKTKEHDGLLRFSFHPSQEVEPLTSKNDGLVKMPVSNPTEALQAQKFLFPNWGEIFVGDVPLPGKTRQLRDHFLLRKREVRTGFEEKVVEAAILSCDQYIAWCDIVAKDANDQYARMRAAGHAWSMGSDAEAAFRDAIVQRQDTVQQDQATNFNDVKETIAGLAQVILAQNQAGNQQYAPPPQPDIDPKDWAEFQAFQAWKSQQSPTNSEQPNQESVNEANGTPFGQYGQCQATTASGERCKGVAFANGFCRVPKHQEQAEQVLNEVINQI